MHTVTVQPCAGISTPHTHLVNIQAAAAQLRKAAVRALADRRSFPAGAASTALAGLIDELAQVDLDIDDVKAAI